jgi:Na+-transporting NADH:ubiquinone oxidoreductase subunit NqrC
MSAAELLLLVLAVASLVGVILQCILLLLSRRRKQRRHHEMLVVATVTNVEEEIKRKVSRWYVTAVWIDTQTQHLYTFRSPPFPIRPKLLVGDTLAVSFNLKHTNHYQMHL